MKNERSLAYTLIAAASITTVIACAPPGATMATEGTLRAPEGSTSGGAALAYVGEYGGGPPGFAGGARVSHQVARNVAVAGEGVLGGMLPMGPSAGLIVGGGRVSTRVSPDSDHFAVTGGLSGGAMNANAGFVGADVGVRVGWNYQRKVELFASQSIAASVLIPGSNTAPFSSPIGYFHSVTEVGVLGRPTERFSLGASLMMLGTITSQGNWLGDRPQFVPGVSAAYTFGGR